MYRERQEEVKDILADREEHVSEILAANREKLTTVPETLLQKEVIYQEKFQRLNNIGVGPCRRQENGS